MKCRICSRRAYFRFREFNLALCEKHFIEKFVELVQKAIRTYRMLSKKERILVAVSGGKDSLVAWEVLNRLGYRTVGFHIVLHIPHISEISLEKAKKFAAERNLPLIIYDVKSNLGKTIMEAVRGSWRTPCAGCGLTKRYIINKFAYEYGFDAVVTGHNIEDSTSALLSNLLRWDEKYLGKLLPVMPPEHEKLVKKAKPLAFMSEDAIKAFADLLGIDYVTEPCPYSADATFKTIKRALDIIEERSPGTKLRFYREYLRKRKKFFGKTQESLAYRECKVCGMPTLTEVCSFCRLWGRTKG